MSALENRKPALAGAISPMVSMKTRRPKAAHQQARFQGQAVQFDRELLGVTENRPEQLLVGSPDRHSQLLVLAQWHFEQRALSVLLRSDDEKQAFRLIHQTAYSPANQPVRDRVMRAWAAQASLSEALQSIKDPEAELLRYAEFPLLEISPTESACHRLLVELRKEYGRG